ncbi:MAG TPA: hypothetical protein VMC62_09895 [Longilinea sp.]|nr:hypothetical protein [Longilinea sp.]
MPSKPTEDLGMVSRLKDQLAVMKKFRQVHEMRRKLDEIDFYPAHDKRLETKAYVAVHKKLTIELDLPCMVCGVRNSTLKDPAKNPFGAKQMETHHHVIEWALANAVDLDKFNNMLLPNLRARHPKNPDYKKDKFTAEDIGNWVDHSEDNLWVLCDVHHRAPFFGIHEITHPIWGPQDLLRDDFEAYARGEIKKAKAEAKAKAGSKTKSKKAK